MDNRPIGIFDSGLGGLSTVRALKQILKNENIVYFGDTGRVPYGTRSNETIETYAAQDIKFLQTFSCKMVVVACGTVSTVASEMIKSLNEYSTGIVLPSVKAAVEATKNNVIGVMGTSATINSNAFKNEIEKLNSDVKTVGVACPLLVNLVENNWIDDKITKDVCEKYLDEIIKSGADTIILGCTHFPILQNVIKEIVGKKVTLIDTGLEEAKYVKDVLTKNNMLNESQNGGEIKYFVSDKTQNFSTVASTLLGEDISESSSFIDILKVI